MYALLYPIIFLLCWILRNTAEYKISSSAVKQNYTAWSYWFLGKNLYASILIYKGSEVSLQI